jgi:hypothetical protein
MAVHVVEQNQSVGSMYSAPADAAAERSAVANDVVADDLLAEHA